MHFSLKSSSLTGLLGLGIILGSIAPTVVAQCSNVYVRKEVRELSSGEFSAFINAIQQLKSGPSPTRYDRYAQVHLQHQREIHGNPFFLPWHRQFTLEFERELQRINPSVSVPYWNWSLDAARPETSPVLQDDMMGGNSFGQCLTSGPFAGWQRPYPSPGCLRRRYSQGSSIGAFANPSIINVITARSTEYDEFRRSIEMGPHAGPHNGIGADMAGMQSPADPLFFLHHSFVDKIWYDWQVSREDNMYKFSGTYNGNAVTADDELIFYPGIRVRDIMDIRSLCYSYTGSSSGPAPQAQGDAQSDAQGESELVRRALIRRADAPSGNTAKVALNIGSVTSDISNRLTKIMKLTHEEVTDIAQKIDEELVTPAPIPESYCRMNNYDIQEVRAQEAAIQSLMETINKVFRTLVPEKHAAYGY
ncbi:MAG: hypothetical protein DHS80DRAFT_22282 [Piptocephalis tieghemiana]|nr:MAG: hypothetical protein DHS80DRAFT_22282 [Piptocephalis tieghemiana]